MSELRKLTLSTNLHELTPLRSNIPNQIRCISTYNMSHQYFQLREFITKPNSIEIDTSSLIIFENRRVDMLVRQRYDLDSVSKKLQCDSTSLSIVRALIEAIIEVFLETSSRLASNGSVIHNTAFEFAIVKI